MSTKSKNKKGCDLAIRVQQEGICLSFCGYLLYNLEEMLMSSSTNVHVKKKIGKMIRELSLPSYLADFKHPILPQRRQQGHHCW